MRGGLVIAWRPQKVVAATCQCDNARSNTWYYPSRVTWDLSFDLQQDRKPDRTTIYAVRPPENRMEEEGSGSPLGPAPAGPHPFSGIQGGGRVRNGPAFFLNCNRTEKSGRCLLHLCRRDYLHLSQLFVSSQPEYLTTWTQWRAFPLNLQGSSKRRTGILGDAGNPR